MAVRARGVRGVRHCHLDEAGSRPSALDLCLCAAPARRHTRDQRGNSVAPQFALRLSKSPDLGVVRPLRTRDALERSVLVADRRDGLAESASKKLSLQCDSDHLRRADLAFVLAQLEARNDLGAWDRADFESGAPSMVLHLD